MKTATSALAGVFGKQGSALFLAGVELFNSGEHWEAHEVFEDVWRLQEGGAKTLAQGFVQIAAAFSYIKKKRYESILYLFGKSAEKLAAAADLLPEANIPQLIDVISSVREEIERLGKEGLGNFPTSRYPRIVITSRRLHYSGEKAIRRSR